MVDLVDQTAEATDDRLDGASVFAGGCRYDVDWVFTSAQLAAQPQHWQRFLGWELELRHSPVDLDVATFLDFRVATADDFRFGYALPLAPGRLFVELVSHRSTDLEPVLRHYVEDLLAVRDYRVVDVEGGATPLFRHPPDRGAYRVRSIGVGAGLAKASTGFALTRMWRDAERIASALSLGHEPAPPLALPSLYRVADDLFADLLDTEPARMVALLESLCTQASGDAVLAFLDERAGAGEQLTIAHAMPDWFKWWLEHPPSERSGM
jgi:hypothetical protein